MVRRCCYNIIAQSRSPARITYQVLYNTSFHRDILCRLTTSARRVDRNDRDHSYPTPKQKQKNVKVKPTRNKTIKTTSSHRQAKGDRTASGPSDNIPRQASQHSIIDIRHDFTVHRKLPPEIEPVPQACGRRADPSSPAFFISFMMSSPPKSSP